MGMKAAHRAGNYFCVSSGPSPPLSSLTGRGRCFEYQICRPNTPLGEGGAVREAPTAPRGQDAPSPPIQAEEQVAKAQGYLGTNTTGTMERLREGQGGHDSHRRLRNRDSGQKFPTASVPKVKLHMKGTPSS